MTISRRPKRPPAPADYSPTEAAAVLLHSRSWVYHESQLGRLPAFTDPDGCTRIRAGDLDDFRAELVAMSPATDLLLRQASLRERGRAGGFAKAASHSREELAAGLQRGRRNALRRQVDPDGSLPADELERRIQAAMNEQMAQARLAKNQRRARQQKYGRKTTSPENSGTTSQL